MKIGKTPKEELEIMETELEGFKKKVRPDGYLYIIIVRYLMRVFNLKRAEAEKAVDDYLKE